MKFNVKDSIKKNQLSYQISKVIVIALLIMIVVQIAYALFVFTLQGKRLKETGSVVANSIEIAIESILDDIKVSAMAFAFDETVGEFSTSEDIGVRYLLSKKINALVQFVCAYNPEVNNILLIPENMNVYAFKDSYKQVVFDQISDRYEGQQLFSDQQNVFFANSNGKDGKEDLLIFKTPVFAQSVTSNLYYEKKGVIVFVMNTDKFYGIINKNQQYSKISITISDKYGKNLHIGEPLIESKHYIEVKRKNEKYGLDVIVSMPKNSFDRENQYFFPWIITTICLFLAIMSLIGIIIYSRITKPLDSLIEQLKTIHIGARKKQIVIERDNEIKKIADEINDMLNLNREKTQRIVETQRRLYEVEISQKEAQFYALQSQINPHFLYNTLSCIKGLALVHELRSIVDITSAMAKIYRYSIKGENNVTVKEELYYIQEYLKIISIRFEERYSFKIDVDERLYEYTTIKMVLQPIVENAIEHGLEFKIEKGFLHISCYEADKKLFFQVEDNGGGFEADALEKMQRSLEQAIEEPLKSNSIGLLNVQNRIRNNFGKAYGIAIRQTEGRTIVTMSQPLSIHKVYE